MGINQVNEVKEDDEALDSVYLEVDLLEPEGTKGALALEEWCRRAGIGREGRVFVWASLPCETMSYMYSVANWSNWSILKLFRYRAKEEGRPPRRDGSKYALKAAEHARLVTILLGIMGVAKWGA